MYCVCYYTHAVDGRSFLWTIYHHNVLPKRLFCYNKIFFTTLNNHQRSIFLSKTKSIFQLFHSVVGHEGTLSDKKHKKLEKRVSKWSLCTKYTIDIIIEGKSLDSFYMTMTLMYCVLFASIHFV